MASWLQGVRCVEMGEGVALAYAGHLLAGLGADVWKLEGHDGDPMRHEGPFLSGRPDQDASARFLFYHAGKRSVQVAPGDQLIGQLTAGSHIVLADGTAARTLGARRLARRGAVVVVVTPFGLTGPYQSLPATDLTYQALAGLMYITGEPARPPLKVGLPIPELAAGQLAVLAALAGLWQQQAGEGGMFVDLSVLEAALTTMEHAPMNWSYRRSIWRRRGNLGAIAGWGLYPCRDGHVGVISGLGKAYDEFRRMVGPPLDDDRFASMAARTRLADEMHAAIVSWLAKRGRRSVVREAQRRGLPFGHLHTVPDLLRSPQFRARRFFRQVPHPRFGPLLYPAGPFRSPVAKWRLERAPLLDEHRETAASLEPLFCQRAAAGKRARKGGLPLEGVRVLEMAVVWAGPLCGRMLADLGAEVIKLETARRPDLMRGPAKPLHPAEGCYPGGRPGDDPWNRHAYFNDRNRNKWGVCVDLDTERGRALALRLVAESDVVIENFTPGALARFGLDYASARTVRPNVVYLSMPAAGLTGPERNFFGYGATNDLMSGLVSVTGYEDGLPQNVGINASDPMAALHGAVAVVAALHQRERTGQGQWLDLSQRESMAHLMGPLVLGYNATGEMPIPTGNRHEMLAPHGVYPCRGDDSWIAIAVDGDDSWAALCKLAGRHLRSMAGWSLRERHERRGEVDSRVASWTKERQREDLWRELRRVGVAAGPVYEAYAFMSDRHLRKRSFWAAVSHPSAGRRLYPAAPWRIWGVRAGQKPAPTLGQHNREVFRRVLGLGTAEIHELEAAGVLAKRPT